MFKLWLEGSRFDYSYHITYLRNVDGIGQSKLMPRGGTSPWQKPHLNTHSQKGIFFCYDKKCVQRWVAQMADQSNDLSDNPIEDQFIPMILRFSINRNSVKPDELANAEHINKLNYYTTKNVDPLGIQMWDGRQWTNDLDSYSIDTSLFIDEDGNILDRYYPYPPELK